MKCLSLVVLAGSLILSAPSHAASTYTYPPTTTEAEVRALVQTANLPRPRLLVGPGEWARLRERVQHDAQLGAIAGRVRRDAEAMLKVPPIERELEGRRLLGESRRAVRRLLTLSLAYHLTQDRRHATRAAQEMRAIAAFSDWNPTHFLDVAEMTFAMAIGYDWLYEQLDGPTRDTVRRAILSKGVRVPLDTEHHRWTRAENNWGQVCHAGMVAGALAVLEDDREAAALTIHRALDHVPHSMAAFAPKGSYPEGPGYWAYGTTYNVLLIALLESTLGGNFGLDRAPGFDQTGAFLALTTGPSGLTFNYSDGGSRRGVEPALHWFARRYQRPEWLTGEAKALAYELSARDDGTSGEDRFLPLLLLWKQDPAGADLNRLPLHWTSEGKVPITLHRSSWTDPNAVFVGFKAGSPSAPHGHMDGGAFVLDADGQRWAAELGAEGYHRIESRGMNFWSMKQDSQRWTVFRQSSLSHNTLVIDGALQQAEGETRIVRFSADPKFPHSVADLSPVYAGQAASVHRGIGILPSGEVLVRDHLTGLKFGAVVRWGMLTPARPGRTGGNALDLRQGEARAKLRIHEPAAATWTLINTAKPPHEWDSPNPGTVMAAFTATAPASGVLTLTVVFSPGSRVGQPAPILPSQPPLEWSQQR